MAFKDGGSSNDLSKSKKVSNKKYIDILKKDINKLSYEESISELEKILSNVQDEIFH